MIEAAHAFDDGTPFEIEDERGTFVTEYLADLVLPTGSIVACDAIVSRAAPPFQKKVPPGRYPVVLSLANPNTGYLAGKQYPFAQVRLSDKRPVRWEMATRAGEDLASLDPDNEDDFFGYPVDSGTGCFMDESARQLWDDLDEEADRVFTDALIAKMGQQPTATESIWVAANVVVDPMTGANLIAFPSGVGDGLYPSFWGYDADDKLACLITDFCLIRVSGL